MPDNHLLSKIIEASLGHTPHHSLPRAGDAGHPYNLPPDLGLPSMINKSSPFI